MLIALFCLNMLIGTFMKCEGSEGVTWIILDYKFWKKSLHEKGRPPLHQGGGPHECSSDRSSGCHMLLRAGHSPHSSHPRMDRMNGCFQRTSHTLLEGIRHNQIFNESQARYCPVFSNYRQIYAAISNIRWLEFIRMLNQALNL